MQLLRFGHEQLHGAHFELAADWLHGHLRRHTGKMAAQAPFIRRNFLSSRFLDAFERRLAIGKRTSPPAVFVKSLPLPLCAAMIVSVEPVARA